MEDDGWKGWCRGPIGFERGGAVTVVVRPEVIRFRTPEGKQPRPGISWRGVIRQRVFRGARTLSIVDVAGRRLSVDAPPGAPLLPDAEVTLDVDAFETWAVRD